MPKLRTMPTSVVAADAANARWRLSVNCGGISLCYRGSQSRPGSARQKLPEPIGLERLVAEFERLWLEVALTQAGASKPRRRAFPG